MQAMRWRLLLVLATAGALSLGIGGTAHVPADVGSGSGPPTSIGHGGAAAQDVTVTVRVPASTLADIFSTLIKSRAPAGSQSLKLTAPRTSWTIESNFGRLIYSQS